MYRDSVRFIAEMASCPQCDGPVRELRKGARWCPQCRTAHSPVPDYEALERELIADALAGYG